MPLTIELHSSQTPWIRSIEAQLSTYPIRFLENVLQTNVVVHMYVWDSQSHTHTDSPWSGYGTVQRLLIVHIARNSCHTQCCATHKTIAFSSDPFADYIMLTREKIPSFQCLCAGEPGRLGCANSLCRVGQCTYLHKTTSLQIELYDYISI